LTQRLLTFASGGAPILRRASIGDLLRNSTTSALRDSIIKCEFSIPDDLWDVEIDEGQIDQVISNIATNSVQAMPAGGIIRVNAENIESDEEHGTPLQKGLYVKIAIEDQGKGIHEEHLQKIFDPFFTTDQRRSGLGLSAAHSIVRNHKGFITVKSRVGVGTTFHIYFPAFSEETPKEPEETGKSIMGSLLVMDDDDMVREVASEVLISAGYRVTPVRNGAEAIESYKSAMESGNPFDAVILDLTIPGGMGGKEALRRLILVDPGIKAIVASGYSNDPVVTDFERYGFKGVIAKPYTAMELIKLLNEVLAKDA